MNRSLLQWHPAFQAVLQIELSGEAEYLQFLKEYNLTDGPLRADTLIIKRSRAIASKRTSGGFSGGSISWNTKIPGRASRCARTTRR